MLDLDRWSPTATTRLYLIGSALSVRKIVFNYGDQKRGIVRGNIRNKSCANFK